MEELAMYTDLEEAKEEIARRRNDPELMKRVEKHFFLPMPQFPVCPCAILARQVATPNFEYVQFNELAKKIGLPPLVWEYTGDIFMRQNREKRQLAKMVFYHGLGKNGGRKTKNREIVDFGACERKPMNEITTLWGENFVGFHHRLFNGNGKCELIEGTEWAKNFGGAKRYYYYFLACFICHGILFDNFLNSGQETNFTKTVVMPAFETLEKIFGVKPLIVKLFLPENENDDYWTWYPGTMESATIPSLNETHAENP